MEWTENKTKLLIEEAQKHPCHWNPCLFWQFIAYAIVQLLKQFYCARKLRHKLPQFIAVCVSSPLDLALWAEKILKLNVFLCNFLKMHTLWSIDSHEN